MRVSSVSMYVYVYKAWKRHDGRRASLALTDETRIKVKVLAMSRCRL